MSEAENLLDTLDDTSVAAADPTTEEHIVIDSNRNVYVPEALRRIGVQYDHNIETVTFDCPRYWDGIDMSKMKVYINYRRSDGKTGRYHAEKVTIDEQWYFVGEMVDNGIFEYDKSSLPIDFSEYESYTIIKTDNYGMTDGEPVYELIRDEGTIYETRHYVCNNQGDPNIIHFDWVISRNATEAKGLLSFLVCINTTDEEGNEIHHWNSELNQQMAISEGLETDSIEDLYPDVITQLLLRMDTVEADNAATRDYIDNGIKTEVDSTIQEMVENGIIGGVDLSGYATLEYVDANYTQLSQGIYNANESIQTNAENIAKNTAFINSLAGIADYPVEVSTKTVDGVAWTYEKMNSGIVKCWGILTAKYNSAKILETAVGFPLSLSTISCVSVSLQAADNQATEYDRSVKYKINNAGGLSVFVYDTNGDFTVNSTATVSAEVKGTWK